MRSCNVRIFFGKGFDFTEQQVNDNHEAYGFVETFLATDPYLVGDRLTVADLACVTSVLQLDLITPIEAERYPKLRAWLQRLAELPYFADVNEKSLKEFAGLFKLVMEANRKAASAATEKL